MSEAKNVTLYGENSEEPLNPSTIVEQITDLNEVISNEVAQISTETVTNISTQVATQIANTVGEEAGQNAAETYINNNVRLYMHICHCGSSVTVVLLNNSETQFTLETLCQWLYNNGFTGETDNTSYGLVSGAGTGGGDVLPSPVLGVGSEDGERLFYRQRQYVGSISSGSFVVSRGSIASRISTSPIVDSVIHIL